MREALLIKEHIEREVHIHLAFPLLLLAITLDEISSDAAFLSSVAIILGAIFVVFQMRDNRRLIEASFKQANASTEQLKQNYDLSTVDLIIRIYDFANSLEFQTSWLTVLKTKISSFEDFEKLPEQKQIALNQVASLFEAVGLLVERGFVKPEIVNDMFATQLAWDSLEPYITGLRKKYPGEDYYYFFERLHERLASIPT